MAHSCILLHLINWKHGNSETLSDIWPFNNKSSQALLGGGGGLSARTGALHLLRRRRMGIAGDVAKYYRKYSNIWTCSNQYRYLIPNTWPVGFGDPSSRNCGYSRTISILDDNTSFVSKTSIISQPSRGWCLDCTQPNSQSYDWWKSSGSIWCQLLVEIDFGFIFCDFPDSIALKFRSQPNTWDYRELSIRCKFTTDMHKLRKDKHSRWLYIFFTEELFCSRCFNFAEISRIFFTT